MANLSQAKIVGMNQRIIFFSILSYNMIVLKAESKNLFLVF